MKTPQEIVEVRWPGWIAGHVPISGEIPLFSLIAEGQREALEFSAQAEKFRPIDAYSFVDLWFILPRTNCDAHNYGKVLFDALETGGIVTNDKFILPRVMGVWHDAKAGIVVKLPRVLIEDQNREVGHAD